MGRRQTSSDAFRPVQPPPAPTTPPAQTAPRGRYACDTAGTAQAFGEGQALRTGREAWRCVLGVGPHVSGLYDDIGAPSKNDTTVWVFKSGVDRTSETRGCTVYKSLKRSPKKGRTS